MNFTIFLYIPHHHIFNLDLDLDLDLVWCFLKGMVSLLSLTDVRESRPPRPPLGLHHPNLKDLELRHGTQMADIRRLVVQKGEGKIIQNVYILSFFSLLYKISVARAFLMVKY